MRNLWIGCAALALGSTQTAAAWQKVSSPHFIIYADGSPDKLRTFATRLEKFDKAVRIVRSIPDPRVGDGNRLTVFVVPDVKAVQALAVLMTDLTPNLAGFYQGSAEGSIAVVPRRSGDTDQSDLEDQSTFFHEYSHHLMYFDLSEPTPLWYAEGFAEFMSTAAFGKDGSVTLGKAALGRAQSVDDSHTFPLNRMLSGKYGKLTEPEWNSLYARSWLLTHYLTFEPTRKGQIEQYLKGIAAGKDPLAAATAAFGDLGILDRNLHGYLGRGRMSAMKVAAQALPVGAISIEPMSAGGAEIMPLRARLKIGVRKADRALLAQQVRAVASRYLTDPFVQATLADAEFQEAHYAATEAAADRALAADPKLIEAMLLKGRAIMEQAALDENGKTFAAARAWYMKANKLDSEDPEPLMLFHQTYVRDSGRPTVNSIAALHYASDLAPQDIGLRIQSAYQYLQDGMTAEARKALVPVAFDPHGGEAATSALAAIAKIDAGDPKGAQAAMRSH